MSARLHVLLGEGGVGKTTLAAGLALALARSGRRVALLGIDPARRLQSALGVSLGSEATRVAELPGGGALHAALLAPEVTLRRWATEGLTDPADRERLLRNKLFAVVADRLATTTDVIAAARIAEWLERDPSLTDVVVDTAPGRNGLEFLRRPTALVALLEGRLVRWLRGEREPGRIRTRVLRSLARLGGAEMVAEFAQLLSVAEGPFRRVLARLEHAQASLHDPSTQILLVTTVREQAMDGARYFCSALAEAGLRARAIVVNRALPGALAVELRAVDDASLGAGLPDLVRYARAYLEIQARVVVDARQLASSLVQIPAARGLDSDGRLDVLARLGDALRYALEFDAEIEP
jgi:anion-transporting  ArsA/GET3 family ATPase